MAAKEVIYFRFWAQPPAHPPFHTRLLPEPVAEPPPYQLTLADCISGHISERMVSLPRTNHARCDGSISVQEPHRTPRLQPKHALLLCALRRKSIAGQWVNGKHNSACGSGKLCELSLRNLLLARSESSATSEN